MDPSAEFERVIRQMEWGEVLDTVQEIVGDLLGDAPIPPPPPPPAAPAAPAAPAEARYDTAYNIPAAAAISALPDQYKNVPVVRLHPSMRNLVPVGIMNGEVVYMLPTDRFGPSAFNAPPPNNPVSKKRKHESQQDEDRPYIKKPPNAFMLFRKEQRPNVMAELNIRESAVVNTVLGQRWKSLSQEEQAKYYEEADKERRLHAQQFPEWSSRDNYGKKRKKQRSRAPTRAEASASQPEEVKQQAKRRWVAPEQPLVMEPCTSQSYAMEALHIESLEAASPPLFEQCEPPSLYSPLSTPCRLPSSPDKDI